MIFNNFNHFYSAFNFFLLPILSRHFWQCGIADAEVKVSSTENL